MNSAALMLPSTDAPFLSQCPLCRSPRRRVSVAFPELSFVECQDCLLIYKGHQSPVLSRGYEENYFVKGRAQYMRRWEHRVRKCQRQLLAALEYCPTASSVLDIGCSVGYVLEAARRLGLSATGCDVSRFAVESCRERGYLAEVGTLTRLPFPDGAFDMVTAKHTLEHSEAPLAALAEIRRVLRPGGALLLVVPDAGYWKRYLLPRSGSYFRPDRLGWQHHVYYSAEHLADAARRAGFTPRKADKAVFRSRLAKGARYLPERLRHLALWAWTRSAATLRLRREVQLICTRQ